MTLYVRCVLAVSELETRKSERVEAEGGEREDEQELEEDRAVIGACDREEQSEREHQQQHCSRRRYASLESRIDVEQQTLRGHE